MRTTSAVRPWASRWHLVTAAAVVVGLVGQLVLQVQGVNILVDQAGRLPGLGTRLVRFCSYFTIQSNVLVAVTAAALARDPARDGPGWRIVRLMALFGITVTGVVYATLLRGVVDLEGAAAITNALLHYVSPSLAVLGWAAFGPRPRLDGRALRAALVWPALYVAYVLVHGAITRWYPYPFIDVEALGYVAALRNGVGLLVVMVATGLLYLWLDGRLRPAPHSAVPPGAPLR